MVDTSVKAGVPTARVVLLGSQEHVSVPVVLLRLMPSGTAVQQPQRPSILPAALSSPAAYVQHGRPENRPPAPSYKQPSAAAAHPWQHQPVVSLGSLLRLYQHPAVHHAHQASATTFAPAGTHAAQQAAPANQQRLHGTLSAADTQSIPTKQPPTAQQQSV